jgi:hypothetical protein
LAKSEEAGVSADGCGMASAKSKMRAVGGAYRQGQ